MADMVGSIKRNIDLKDDIRQAFIVMRYEFMKFVSGKKIFIYAAINLIILAIVAAIFFTSSGNTTTEGMMGDFISFLSLILLIGVTLFASVTLVSEFEERTSLLLFTKPIRKGSIFAGKFLAAYLLCFAIVIVYYVASAIITSIETGGFTSKMFPSLGYCALDLFALTGIAMMFSALMKKSSSASILTFVFILLVPAIIQVVVSVTADLDPWFMLNYAEAAVMNSISGYSSYDGPRDAAVMFIWGLIPLIASYFLFRGRQV